MSIHLTQFFDVTTDSPDSIFDDAGRIMEALAEMEASDGRVTDGTVSVNTAAREVSIEVYMPAATGSDDDLADAQRWIAEAMHRAGLDVYGEAPQVHERKREVAFA